METNPERDPEDPSEAEHPKITTELSRNLTLLQVTMMGVGMMIGAGVFLGVCESCWSGRGHPHLCAQRGNRTIHGHVLC